MSLVAVYVPTVMCEADEKDVFYAKPTPYWTSVSAGYKHIVFGDFNVVTGAERAGYALCVDLHDSGTRRRKKQLSAFDFCKFQKIKN